MLTLHVIQARHGDCLLVEWDPGAAPNAAAPTLRRFILIDGGPSRVYRTHLKPELERLAAAGATLDRVLLTHVDDDHVKGLLDLFTDLVRQKKAGQDPVIALDGLWHNTFSQAVGGDVLAVALQTLPPALCAHLLIVPTRGAAQARSIGQGDRLTQLAAGLAVPANQDFPPPRRIETAAPPPVVEFDGLRVTVVGPTPAQLDALRAEWLEWLARQAARPQGVALDTSVPNLSSIVLLAEADGRRLLLTGDARGDQIVEGLAEAGMLDGQGRCHVDVLKLPHHGSVRNVTPEFFHTVTADTYVICADGKHDNPDPPTLEWLAAAARAQGRRFRIVATTRTESLREMVRRFPPAEFGYEVAVLPRERIGLRWRWGEGGGAVLTPENQGTDAVSWRHDPKTDGVVPAPGLRASRDAQRILPPGLTHDPPRTVRRASPSGFSRPSLAS